MEYRDAIHFLFNSLPMYQRTGGAAYKANLENSLALDRYFGAPHRSFRSIHVAGTNGKGSVSHMLASILQESGLRTGLYTSPHLLDFRERIRVDGIPVSKREVGRFVSQHRKIIGKVSPSFFEMTVAMAFDTFKRAGVEAAVIEVGMGGRLDSTNIITPQLSVITNISLDHTAFLGTTIPSIASEKGGIIKEGVPVVLGPMREEAAAVLRKIAGGRHAPVVRAVDSYRPQFGTASLQGISLFRISDLKTKKLHSYPCGLNGAYQAANLTTVLTAVRVLRDSGWDIADRHVRKGLESVVDQTGIMGRWQTVGTSPRSVCDCAHNPEGVAAVVGQARQTPWKHLHIVWGMVSDKDRGPILSLLPGDATYYFTASGVPRALEAGQLATDASARGLTGKAYPTVREAYGAAMAAAGKDDMILTGGSTFVVADLLAALGY